MAPRNRHKKNQVSKESNAYSDATNLSAMQSNKIFFENQHQQLQIPAEPSHSSSITWKSPWVKEKEEYERIRHRVRHFAPTMFKGRGKELFPQDTSEWIEHKRGMAAMNEAGLRDDIVQMKHMITIKQENPKGQKLMKTLGGKKFNDGLSSVLALPTIWTPVSNEQSAEWPNKAEVQLWNEGNQDEHGRTKPNRSLPPPRIPGTTIRQQAFIRPLPLDISNYGNGSSPDETKFYNSLMDNDPDFEARGAFLSGSELMDLVGERKKPYIPERQYGHLQQLPEESEAEFRYVRQDMGTGMVAPEFMFQEHHDMDGQYHDSGQHQGQAAFYAGEDERHGVHYGQGSQFRLGNQEIRARLWY